jgi:OFA family oxalate/formate antiporter-like MFS transporter
VRPAHLRHIANLQYGWILFVNPIDQKYHWGKAAIQVAFTFFMLTETWLVPFRGGIWSISSGRES